VEALKERVRKKVSRNIIQEQIHLFLQWSG
jgi:hypothetical protein